MWCYQLVGVNESIRIHFVPAKFCEERDPLNPTTYNYHTCMVAYVGILVGLAHAMTCIYLEASMNIIHACVPREGNTR